MKNSPAWKRWMVSGSPLELGFGCAISRGLFWMLLAGLEGFCMTNAVGAPFLTGFSPGFGVPGAAVTINGSGFTGVLEVRFGTAPALFTVLSPTVISASVPLDGTTGPVGVVTTAGAASSAASFVVAPRIDEFDPPYGVAGTTIVIQGANFGGTTSVSFGGRAAGFSVPSENQVHAVVPAGAVSGPIAITTPAGTARSDLDFRVLGPEPFVTEFSPVHGAAGTRVVIEGVNFTGATGVRFNGVNAASFSVVAPTQISAVVPAGAAVGPISVISRAGTGTSSGIFLATAAPVIADFEPKGGAPGSSVVLEGINFTGATSVKFNGVEAASFSVTAPTQLHAIVPPRAGLGPISVTTRAGTGTSLGLFTATTAPLLAEFFPTNGPAGTLVSILGVNFLPVTSVKFGGRTASFSVVGPTELLASVPIGATSGPVSVASSFGASTSAWPFLVVGAAPLVTGFTPEGGGAGTRIRVEGFNFFGVTRVTINGAPASFSAPAPTLMTVLAPENVFTGPIAVTTTAGTGVSAQVFYGAPRIFAVTPTNGFAGDAVVVTGQNFAGTSAVRFGGALAEFAVNRTNELTAIVPLAALSGSISITTPAGIVGSTNEFVVRPRITGFSPGGGPAGTLVTVMGSGFGGATAVRFNGVDGQFQVVSPTEIRTVVPAGASEGLIQVVTPGGSAVSAAPFRVSLLADLSVGQTDAPDPVFLGRLLTYTLSVTNRGPSAASGIRLTNYLDAGVSFVSATVSQGSSGRSGGAVHFDLGGLAPGASARAVVTVAANRVGSVTNAAEVFSNEFDTNLVNNASAAATQVIMGTVRVEIAPLADGKVEVSWPAADMGWRLQFTESLSPPVIWRDLLDGPIVDRTRQKVTLPATGEARFYRLQRP